jgi:GT2 family glycosyltransferase
MTSANFLPSDSSETPSVSVIVVSYNTREMTLECLRSVLRETQQETFEVIVVDNQSQDGSAEAIAAELPEIRLIQPDANLGFARANNLAAESARGEYLLLLNPDTVVLDAAIDRVIDFARQHPEAGIWGGRTLDGERALDPSSCWGRISLWSLFCRAVGLNVLFSRSEFFNPECYGDWQRDRIRDVDIVSGCFFLIRRELWESLNGFDPVFFMYAEEADLCLRARRIGVRPRITPEATIVHYGGASEPKEVDKRVRLIRAQLTLIRRHWAAPSRWLGERLILFTQWVRYTGYSTLAAVSKRDDRAARAQIWKEVWKLRRDWFEGYQSTAGSDSAQPDSHPSREG